MEFEYQLSVELPALAWLARIGSGRVAVSCGRSVRTEPGGFFEGTWAGPADLAALPGATTVFGSGIVADGEGVLLVTPSHNLEGVYVHRAPAGAVASNSLVGLLVGTGLELDPSADYSNAFLSTSAGIDRNPVSIPLSGGSLELHFHENLRLDAAGRGGSVLKPREEPFASYHDYYARLRQALGSMLANAGGRRAVVALSSGYDSTAVAVLAAGLGARRAVGLRTGKRFGDAAEVADSGAETARRLGLDFSLHERLSYLERDDLPEAEFLATGMPAEDVVFSAFEEHLRGALLLEGSWPSGVWSRDSPRSVLLEREDLSGASLTEFRLRLDCVVVRPAFFGATQQPSLVAIARSPEMRPYSIGGSYDRPIPRRIAEDAGLPRGSFATHKRGGSVNINQLGSAGLAPATLRSIREFGAAAGRSVTIGPGWRPAGRHRLAIRLARRLGVPALAAGLERRRRASKHFLPPVGNLLLSWAVEQLRPRYSALRER